MEIRDDFRVLEALGIASTLTHKTLHPDPEVPGTNLVVTERAMLWRILVNQSILIEAVSNLLRRKK